MAAPKAEKTTKPRKAPARKKATTEAAEPIVIHPSHADIAALAHKFWADRGYTHGNAEHDWLRAEQELMKAS
jgi:Protein of unknown function (DUF2934)